MPLLFSKTDLKLQIVIDLDYAAKMTGPNAAHAVALARLLATQLTDEERIQLADSFPFAKTIDFERALIEL